MKKDEFYASLNEQPIIAAVKDRAGLTQALESDCQVVFVLFGNILNIAEITTQIQLAGKVAMVHIDLIDGLAMRDISVDFIATTTKAAGIISTKQSLIRRAGECKLLAVQRFFVLDSMAISNIKKQVQQEYACAVEILPGLMPSIISEISSTMSLPVIAGGLISKKADIISALGAGACAVSTTNSQIWFL